MASTPEPIADPMVGTVLDGRYRILQPIGKGGMGTVFRATQLGVLEREVAIKILAFLPIGDNQLTARFEQEARIIAQLRHPNTLKLVDSGRLPDGRLYVVTELLQGQPLDRILKGEVPIGTLRTLGLARQICDALAEAHSQGIVHRDLKPGNVMVERVGDQELAKVLDFGIAKASHFETLTQGLEVFGTPGYMSPEQARGLKVDGRSDLYALGVLMYECLTGKAPFESKDGPVALLLQHVQEPVPSLASRTAEFIHPTVETLVLSLLEKEPDQRPPSATAVRNQIDRVLRGLRSAAFDPSEGPTLIPDPVEIETDASGQLPDFGVAVSDTYPSVGVEDDDTQPNQGDLEPTFAQEDSIEERAGFGDEETTASPDEEPASNRLVAGHVRLEAPPRAMSSRVAADPASVLDMPLVDLAASPHDTSPPLVKQPTHPAIWVGLGVVLTLLVGGGLWIVMQMVAS